MLHYRFLSAALLLAMAVLNRAHADPWPDYSAHPDSIPYVQVSSINTSGTLWDCCVSVSPGSFEPEHGGLAGVKALAIYPNGGYPEPMLAGWTGDAEAVRAGWDTNGGWHVQQGAFGYRTSGPSLYIAPGLSNQFIVRVRFPAAYTPPSQVFLVHVACNDGYTYWARTTVVPEPGLASTCAAGIIPFVSLMRRRRR